MKLIIYDTEFTAWEGSMQRGWSEPWEAKELIQFAGHLVEFKDNQIISLAEFDEFVKPIKNPLLSDYIQELTGISQQNVDSGLSPKTFFEELFQFTEQGAIPMTSWGNDLFVLEETAEINELSADWIQSFDLRPLFDHFKINTRTSSGNLYKEFGLNLQIHEHNAFDDVRSLSASLDALNEKQPQDVSRLTFNLINR